MIFTEFMVLLFAAELGFRECGPEKTKNLAARKVLRLIRIRLARPSLRKLDKAVKGIHGGVIAACGEKCGKTAPPTFIARR
jgi:hypothetical protein